MPTTASRWRRPPKARCRKWLTTCSASASWPCSRPTPPTRDSDRAALDQEVQQRLAEIDRIATQTSFNGRKVLDGSFGNATFQVGANVGETISVGLATSVKTADIGNIFSSAGAAVDVNAVIAATADTPAVAAVAAVATTSGASGAFSERDPRRHRRRVHVGR